MPTPSIATAAAHLREVIDVEAAALAVWADLELGTRAELEAMETVEAKRAVVMFAARDLLLAVEAVLATAPTGLAGAAEAEARVRIAAERVAHQTEDVFRSLGRAAALAEVDAAAVAVAAELGRGAVEVATTWEDDWRLDGGLVVFTEPSLTAVLLEAGRYLNGLAARVALDGEAAP